MILPRHSVLTVCKELTFARPHSCFVRGKKKKQLKGNRGNAFVVLDFRNLKAKAIDRLGVHVDGSTSFRAAARWPRTVQSVRIPSDCESIDAAAT